MTFGEAIEECKKGAKIQREGWNGKGQYVVLAYMQRCVTVCNDIIGIPFHENIGNKFLMFVGTSGYQCGWLASQADMLADDWKVI